MHYSVLLQESINDLNVNPQGIYIDATFGRGGHSKAILDRLTIGHLIAFDKDLNAISYAKQNFQFNNFEIIHASFASIYDYCLQNNLLGKIDGIIMDFGVSSPQLDNAARGFSFMHNGPLDMRMDVSKGITASQALEELSVDDLSYIFKVYGEERFARKIALCIKDYIQQNGSVNTTLELAELIRTTIGKRENKNPATRCFQALRIYVNNELKDLEALLENILAVIKVGGRIAAISFHSLEDRLVKQKFSALINPKQELNRITKMLPQDSSQIKLKWITKKTKANDDELNQNVRSRSAILRVVEKL
ncbi:16S rRNA (cytosine(1402)-N(4))-methyltransferase [Francisella endosymbiont of Ornithodoros moubata]|uniref:16S rRNA (cytosine(1402)-N(4))-methyltransferase RsmH n=1 Tax=Francisella-like endosymbiont TaxID=512373 RepID=UPI000A216986|nr:16S rRNA (cytosine(1402)-N(4))-methyltransferase [Francisella endosymbiont of Ornithodoros moubata]